MKYLAPQSVLAFTVFLGATSAQIMPVASADFTLSPAYVGLRTGNPEKDTYAFHPSDHDGRRLAFIGPAHQIGTATGNPEKDTWGYQPVLLEKVANLN